MNWKRVCIKLWEHQQCIHIGTYRQKWFDRKRYFSTYFFRILSVFFFLIFAIWFYFFILIFSFNFVRLWFARHQIAMAIVASSSSSSSWKNINSKRKCLPRYTATGRHMSHIWMPPFCCLFTDASMKSFYRLWPAFCCALHYYYLFSSSLQFCFALACDYCIVVVVVVSVFFWFLLRLCPSLLILFAHFIPFPAHFIKIKSPIAYLVNFINNSIAYNCVLIWCVIHIRVRNCVYDYYKNGSHNNGHTVITTTTATTKHTRKWIIRLHLNCNHFAFTSVSKAAIFIHIIHGTYYETRSNSTWHFIFQN